MTKPIRTQTDKKYDDHKYKYISVAIAMDDYSNVLCE